MAKMHVKKGDTVLVISGKDRGVTGKVIAAYPREQRVLVEGVNRIKKHTRITTTQRGAQTGGIVTQEAAIHVSNVMLLVDAPKSKSDNNDKDKKVSYQGQRGAKEGGITHEEAPINVSNVQLTDPDDSKKAARAGYRFDEDGNKIRVARPSGKDI